jgi:hypothetical protein
MVNDGGWGIPVDRICIELICFLSYETDHRRNSIPVALSIPVILVRNAVLTYQTPIKSTSTVREKVFLNPRLCLSPSSSIPVIELYNRDTIRNAYRLACTSQMQRSPMELWTNWVTENARSLHTCSWLSFGSKPTLCSIPARLGAFWVFRFRA